jgi:hypothetical protein
LAGARGFGGGRAFGGPVLGPFAGFRGTLGALRLWTSRRAPNRPTHPNPTSACPSASQHSTRLQIIVIETTP